MPFAGISFVSNIKNCSSIKCLILFSLQLHISVHVSYTAEVKTLVDRFLFNLTPKHLMLSYSISLISECFLQKTPIFQFRPVVIIPLGDIFHDFLSYMDLLLQSINALNYPTSRIKTLFVRNVTKLFYGKFIIPTTTLGYEVAKVMRASAT